MKTSKVLISSVFAVCAVGLFGLAPNASAANLNTHGAVCQPYIQTETLDYNSFGVRNLSGGDRTAVCPMVRSPLASTGSSGGFYVDGANPVGGTTHCTLSSHDFTGDFLGSQTFSDSSDQFSRFLSLPEWQVPTYAYVAVVCTMPDGGILHGVTAIQ
jgi:hypothetical protein